MTVVFYWSRSAVYIFSLLILIDHHYSYSMYVQPGHKWADRTQYDNYLWVFYSPTASYKRNCINAAILRIWGNQYKTNKMNWLLSDGVDVEGFLVSRMMRSVMIWFFILSIAEKLVDLSWNESVILLNNKPSISFRSSLSSSLQNPYLILLFHWSLNPKHFFHSFFLPCIQLREHF